jgi:hypothetical protein
MTTTMKDLRVVFDLRDVQARIDAEVRAEIEARRVEIHDAVHSVFWEEYSLLLLREERTFERRSGWREATGFPVTDLGGEG